MSEHEFGPVPADVLGEMLSTAVDAHDALVDEVVQLRGQLDALRAVLLHPPTGASDGEVLAAARALLRSS